MNHIDVHRASTRTCSFKENRFLLYPAKTSAFYHRDSRPMRHTWLSPRSLTPRLFQAIAVTFLGSIRLSKWLSYWRRHWQLSLWRRNWRWGCPAVRWFNTSQKHNGVCMCLPKTAAGLALAWLIACVSDRRVGLVMIFGCGSAAAVPAITETKLCWRYWVALDWSQCLACHGGHGVFLPDGSAFCVSGKVCVGVREALTSWYFWVKDSFTLWKQNCNWPWFHCCSPAADGRPCHSGPVVYRGDIRKSCNALLAPPWLVIS